MTHSAFGGALRHRALMSRVPSLRDTSTRRNAPRADLGRGEQLGAASHDRTRRISMRRSHTRICGIGLLGAAILVGRAEVMIAQPSAWVESIQGGQSRTARALQVADRSTSQMLWRHHQMLSDLQFRQQALWRNHQMVIDNQLRHQQALWRWQAREYHAGLQLARDVLHVVETAEKLQYGRALRDAALSRLALSRSIGVRETAMRDYVLGRTSDQRDRLLEMNKRVWEQANEFVHKRNEMMRKFGGDVAVERVAVKLGLQKDATTELYWKINYQFRNAQGPSSIRTLGTVEYSARLSSPDFLSTRLNEVYEMRTREWSRVTTRGGLTRYGSP
jgi:hypothetical protein